MNEHRRPSSDGLPVWLSIVVVNWLLALFTYNLIVVGEKGYPTNVLIAGLLGGYLGVDIFKRRKTGQPPTDAHRPPSDREPPAPPGGGGGSW